MGDIPPVRPNRSLKGRVAIITGAGALGEGIGNGRAASILLAEDGCSVVCVDMQKPLVDKTVSMIKAEGKGEAIAATGDVTKAEDCQNIVQTAISIFGRLDILVNNVGIGGARGTAEQVDMVEWAKSMEVNVSSMVLMAKYSIPEMKKNEGQWRGSIVNLGSVAGIKGNEPGFLVREARFG
jgi:NAD(P)-dependent dehydrogenase (short-subunit alcohol dehydrogenase family)